MVTAGELLEVLLERSLPLPGVPVEAVSVIVTTEHGNLYRYTIDKEGLWIVESVRRTRATPTYA